MRTNIVIDDALMAEALKRSGLATKRDVVDLVMRRYLQVERQKEAIKGLRGMGWEGDLDEMRTDKPLPEWR